MEIIFKSVFTVKTVLIDIAHYSNGESKVINVAHNIIVDKGLALGAGTLGGIATGISLWKVGSGLAAWDVAPPDEDPATVVLVTPLVAGGEITTQNLYWDRDAKILTVAPKDTIDVRALFTTAEGNGTLRECLILGGSPPDIPFAYVIHDKIIKDSSFNLERIYRVTIERS